MAAPPLDPQPCRRLPCTAAYAFGCLVGPRWVTVHCHHPEHLAAELKFGVLPTQVSRCRAYIESLETKLAGQQEYVSGLEGRLQADLARVAPLLGQGLDDLSAAQLSSLVRVHEDGARRARAMLVSHRLNLFVGLWPGDGH